MSLERVPSRELLIAAIIVADKLFESIVDLVDVFNQLVIIGAAKPLLTLIALKVLVVVVQRNSMPLQDLLCTEISIANVAHPHLLLLLNLLV